MKTRGSTKDLIGTGPVRCGSAVSVNDRWNGLFFFFLLENVYICFVLFSFKNILS